MIINGGMQVAQRGTSLAMAHDGTNSSYLIDRWRIALNGTDQLDGTYAQVADHPLGGTGTSLKWTTGTAESAIASDEYGYIGQIIEAQNLQHLRYATSNAETVTLSFYVKSSITGTFAVGFYKPDTSTRIFNKTYTIDSANTWEKKTLTFVGDTDSSAGIANDNGQGIWVSWHLVAGSDYDSGDATSGWTDYATNKWASGQATDAVVTTAGATFQITECQLEVGEQATPFEHRSFGEEVDLCLRYFQLYDSANRASGIGGGRSLGDGVWYLSSLVLGNLRYNKVMRTAPTFSVSGADFATMYYGGGGQPSNDTNPVDLIGPDSARLNIVPATNRTQGHGCTIILGSEGSWIKLDAEL